MPNTRVVAIDAAPGKPSTVFDGVEYKRLPAADLRDFIAQIASGGVALVCWGAPLTGPPDPKSAGSGAAIAAASRVAVFGGPAGLALLAGLSASMRTS